MQHSSQFTAALDGLGTRRGTAGEENRRTELHQLDVGISKVKLSDAKPFVVLIGDRRVQAENKRVHSAGGMQGVWAFFATVKLL